MKQIIVIMVLTIVIAGCEKRQDPFEADNTYPILDLKTDANDVNQYEYKIGSYKNNSSSFDSTMDIYDTIKDNYNNIILTTYTNNEGYRLKHYRLSCNDTITKLESDIGDTDNIHTGYGRIIISNYAQNSNYTKDTVLVQATDYYNKTTTARIIICYIENLNPYAYFDVVKVGQVSPYEIRVDASDSYDSDSRYGGAIVAYHFDIDGYTVQNDDPILNHVLPGPGTYTIKVKVQDNNGMWSQEKQTTIDL